MLKVENISFKVGNNNILTNLSIDVEKGEIITFFGKSGCGKSTLLNIISGLLIPTYGIVKLNNTILKEPSQQISFVFQETSLLPFRTVKGNVEFGMELKHISKIEKNKTSTEVLKKVGLYDIKDKYPNRDKLSGGMKQRVEIAGVLADQKEIILMDEPFSALDDITREEMQDFVLKIWKEFNLTILFVTHNKEEAILLSDKIVLMPNKESVLKEIKIMDIKLERPRNINESKFIDYKKILTAHLKKTNEEIVREKYNFRDDELLVLLEEIVNYILSKGVKITYANLEPVIETNVYTISRSIKPEDEHHETCISDGKEIWLHNDLEDVGGIMGRIYDLLHVGCGHLWQWSATAESGFEFYGDYAWEFGSQSFLFATASKISEVWRYEEEASRICMQNLAIILSEKIFTNSFKNKFLDFFNDYCVTDLHYITNYYKTGKVLGFYDDWKFDADKLPTINANISLKNKRRSNKCIPLIKK